MPPKFLTIALQARPLQAPSLTAAPVGVGLKRSYGSARSIVALILREISTSYGRSVGGYAWAILEPLGTVFLLSIGFSLIMHSPALGSNFIFFYATGFLPFHTYQQIASVVARSIQFSRPLLFYPAVSWVDAVFARFILNAITNVAVACIIFICIYTYDDIPVQIEVRPILVGVLLMLFLGFGIGILNCAISGLYPTWELIWSIATKPLFLASGIFFIYEDMPRQAQGFLWYNPLIHITGIIRSGFFPMYNPEYTSATYVCGIALTTTAFGILLLSRFHRDILHGA